jgi:hypothetical protein
MGLLGGEELRLEARFVEGLDGQQPSCAIDRVGADLNCHVGV